MLKYEECHNMLKLNLSFQINMLSKVTENKNRNNTFKIIFMKRKSS